jgi:hypothetical protein
LLFYAFIYNSFNDALSRITITSSGKMISA